MPQSWRPPCRRVWPLAWRRNGSAGWHERAAPPLRGPLSWMPVWRSACVALRALPPVWGLVWMLVCARRLPWLRASWPQNSPSPTWPPWRVGQVRASLGPSPRVSSPGPSLVPWLALSRVPWPGACSRGFSSPETNTSHTVGFAMREQWPRWEAPPRTDPKAGHSQSARIVATGSTGSVRFRTGGVPRLSRRRPWRAARGPLGPREWGWARFRPGYTKHCSKPCSSTSLGRSMPMKTSLLIFSSPGAHFGPRSLPMSWCTPWKMTLRSLPFMNSTPL